MEFWEWLNAKDNTYKGGAYYTNAIQLIFYALVIFIGIRSAYSLLSDYLLKRRLSKLKTITDKLESFSVIPENKISSLLQKNDPRRHIISRIKRFKPDDEISYLSHTLFDLQDSDKWIYIFKTEGSFIKKNGKKSKKLQFYTAISLSDKEMSLVDISKDYTGSLYRRIRIQ